MEGNPLANKPLPTHAICFAFMISTIIDRLVQINH